MIHPHLWDYVGFVISGGCRDVGFSPHSASTLFWAEFSLLKLKNLLVGVCS
jgi:hypothetical protein